MKITKSSKAGTLESNDILIMVTPNDKGNKLEFESIVKLQFGEHIEKLILNKLKEMQVENAYIKAQDKGALDYTIISRVETAIKRAI